MIKKLSFKFVLVFLVLVVSVFITSSCYAFSTDYISTSPVTIEELKEASGKTFSENTNIHVIAYKNISSGEYKIYLLYGNGNYPLDDAQYFYTRTYNSAYYVSLYSTSNSVSMFYSVEFNFLDDVLTCKTAAGSSNFGANLGILADHSLWVVCDITTLPVRDSVNGTVIYEPNQISVEVTHEFQSDTSAKINFSINNAPDGAYLQYSLTGVEINTDLTAPLQLRNPITYTSRSNKFNC